MTITTSQAIESICKRLNAAGIDSARLDARLIVADSVGVDIKDLINLSESCLSVQQLSKIESKVLARSKRQPMDKIRGLRGFWDLEFLVTKDTMSPRPDSEALIEAVISNKFLRESPFLIIKLRPYDSSCFFNESNE